MASISFNRLKSRTKVDNGESLADKKSMRELLSNSLIMQNSISDQYRKVQTQYNKNKGLYNLLLKEVLDIKKEKNRPKYDKISNPIGSKKGNGGGSGGLLGSLLGAGLSGLLLAPFITKIKKGLSTLTKGIKNSIGKMFSSATKAGKNSISRISSVLKRESVKKVGDKLNLNKIKNSQIGKAIKGVGQKGLNKAIVRGSQLGLGKSVGRVAIKQVTRMIGAGVVGAAAGTIGMPLLIASAAAGVGYGSYKIGRYLKLSERLDGFINKVSNGKYKNIVDLVLGLTDGSVGKELYSWVKEKVNTLFDDTVIGLKNKVNEVLGKFSPFNDTDEPEVTKTETNKDSSSNVSPGETSFSSILKGASNSTASTYDKLKSVGSGVLQSGSSMVQGSQSDSSESSGSVSPNSDSSNVSGGDLAWHSITKGKNTEITSGYGPRWGSQHTGIDIAAKVGTPIYAPEDGHVTTNTHKTGGIQGFVTAKSGTKYGFAHLSKMGKTGAVKKGDLIAYSGNTGKSTGPHIHLSIRQPGGKRVDPQTYKIPGIKGNSSKGTGEMGDFQDIKSNYDSTEKVKTINYNNIINSNNTQNNNKSNENTLKASVPRTTTMQQPQKSNGTKSGAISGSLKDTKDPRGALSSTVLSASTSPLFI